MKKAAVGLFDTLSKNLFRGNGEKRQKGQYNRPKGRDWNPEPPAYIAKCCLLGRDLRHGVKKKKNNEGWFLLKRC